MARIFTTVVKRITQVIAGSVTNWRANVRAGTRTSIVGTLRGALQRPATRASTSPSTLRAALQRPATRVSARVADSLITPLQRPAARQTVAPAVLLAARPRPASRASLAAATLVGAKPRAAGNIVQVQYDLNHAGHVVTAANELGATKAWTNPANAQGAPNGTLAAFDGDALLLAVADLGCDFAAQVNRPAGLLIQSVHMDFYGSVIGLPAVSDLVSRLNLRFNAGFAAGPHTLESINTGAADFTATPKSYRLDNGAGQFIDSLAGPVSWASVNAITASWDATTVLGLVAAHYRADAVRLRIVASETDIN